MPSDEEERVMAARGSLANQTPPAIWSDGIHFVRPVAKTDSHPMRWYAGAHKMTDSTLKRYCPTLDDALKIAMAATKKWFKEHPSDRAYFKMSPLPSASTLVGPKKKRGRPPKPKVEDFSTYHFDCVAANPYAQVWQCTSYPGERAKVGRKKADGSQPEQTPVRHVKGQCSVLMGKEPVRNPDGTVRIFNHWAEADEFAYELYLNAPEDEVISWKPGDIVIQRTTNFDVKFDPAINGTYRPFNLWNVTYNKPVYVDKTRPAVLADDRSAKSIRQMQETNPEGYLQIMDARSKARKLDRVPSFSEEELKFRSIWEALAEAERREKMLRGIPV